MCTEPEALDRHGPEAELTLGLVELGAPLDVHALAVGELERETVVAPAGDRRRQAGSVAGSLSVKKTVAHAGLRRSSVTSPSTQTSGQPPEPVRDPLVEGGDGEDLAVADDRRLDLHGPYRRGEASLFPKHATSHGTPCGGRAGADPKLRD